MTPRQETTPTNEHCQRASPDDPTLPIEPSDQSDELVADSHGSESEHSKSPEFKDIPLETQKEDEKEVVKDKVLTPYGLPCVRELLRFLISIINTQERTQDRQVPNKSWWC